MDGWILKFRKYVQFGILYENFYYMKITCMLSTEYKTDKS